MPSMKNEPITTTDSTDSQFFLDNVCENYISNVDFHFSIIVTINNAVYF